MKAIVNHNFHIQTVNQILEIFKTGLDGISIEEAEKRLKKFGPNVLEVEKSQPIWFLFLKQLKSPLIYILLGVAVITFFLKKPIDTWVILGVVLLNSFLGFFQEKKAEEALRALKKLTALKAKVIRGGEKHEISAEILALGDLTILEIGSKIPADLRLIKTTNLEVDESILTGESTPVLKNIRLLLLKTQVADQKNMAFSGTIVVAGRGLGIVTAIGSNTQFGQIAKGILEIKEPKTPLEIKIALFAKKLLFFIFTAVGFLLLAGVITGLNFVELFLTAAAMAVSAIPEGLPAVITICLATGVRRMAKNKAITRKLSTVETLGSVNLIASDKTGTLTYNQMTLEAIYTDSKELKVTGKGYKPEGQFLFDGKVIDPQTNFLLNHFLKTGVLVNDAELIEKEGFWGILGDPTEGAFMVAGAKAKFHKGDLEKEFPRIHEIPFTTERGWMATLHKGPKHNLICVKGIPETTFSLSNKCLLSTGEKDFTNLQKKEFLKKTEEFAGQGLRVLALAYKRVPKTIFEIKERDINNLCLLGIGGLDDPPREEVKQVISKCHNAGIRVVMVTGDHPLTARFIASQIGLFNNHLAIVGQELDALSDSELEKLTEKTNVFARVSPSQKLRLVKIFQKKNYIVAVTGDGVNDAPALKQADVGVAMGISGTDVSREASDFVLTDDNFVTIVKAIEEGRTIFRNIRRVVLQLVSTNAGEVFVIISSLLLGWPLPLLPVQILWINLVTDGFAGLPLALEPKHADILAYKPNTEDTPIISSMMWFRIFLVAITMTIGTLILYNQALNGNLDKARTIAFVAMVFFQVLNMFNSRSIKNSIFQMKFFDNLWVIIAFIISVLMTILVVHNPLAQSLFHMKSISINDWLVIISVSLSVIGVVEIEKLIRKLIKNRSEGLSL